MGLPSLFCVKEGSIPTLFMRPSLLVKEEGREEGEDDSHCP